MVIYSDPKTKVIADFSLRFQLCFLDFRTGEVHGPRPCIKRDDYDTKFPLNIDDIDLLSSKAEETNTRFTDMTLSRIRFECNEMHRIIWYDRMRLEKKKITLTHLLGKIESFRRAMVAKYKPILDLSVSIQYYASTMMTLLLERMHVMVLHRYINNYNLKVPDRLRQICLTGGVEQMVAAVELEKAPSLARWKWYNGAHQQWHTAFLLLVEVYRFPNRKEADRVWDICDFVFETDTSLSRAQKARSIMIAVKDRIAVYRDMRRMRAPLSMRAEDVIRVYVPKTQPGQDAENKDATDAVDTSPPAVAASRPSPHSVEAVAHAVSNADPNSSWNFDSPATFFSRPVKSHANTQRASFDTTPYHAAAAATGFSPSHQSESSGSNEHWPPYISSEQGPWRAANAASSTSPPTNNLTVLQAALPLQQPGVPLQMASMQRMYPADTPAATMPNTTPSDDSLMLDIDWVSSKMTGLSLRILT
jgi:hypothetical protein